MKRMLSFISDQRLPNFIPINEPATRPDALHLVYTPRVDTMRQRYDDLRRVLTKVFPEVRLEDPLEVDDAYDGRGIYEACAALLRRHPHDSWSLNATGGTKLMSAPAMDLFRREGWPVYYVDTPHDRIVQVRHDWSLEALAFVGTIGLETYFDLHGATVTVGKPRTRQERHLYETLKRLDWSVFPSVVLSSNALVLAEYDVVGIRHYQMSVFECKRLRRLEASPHHTDDELRKAQRRQRSDVSEDLMKLDQVRNHFGGPFGRIFWVLGGGYELTEHQAARIRQFRITLLREQDVPDLARHPERYGLPPRPLGGHP